jgi:hypothetical protein
LVSTKIVASRPNPAIFIDDDADKQADEEEDGDEAEEAAEAENGADAVLKAVQRLRALPQVVDVDFKSSSVALVEALFAGVTGLQCTAYAFIAEPSPGRVDAWKDAEVDSIDASGMRPVGGELVPLHQLQYCAACISRAFDSYSGAGSRAGHGSGSSATSGEWEVITSAPGRFCATGVGLASVDCNNIAAGCG